MRKLGFHFDCIKFYSQEIYYLTKLIFFFLDGKPDIVTHFVKLANMKHSFWDC